MFRPLPGTTLIHATADRTVLALLEILQDGTQTALELAKRLDVDEPTVRRYAAHLLDLDVPIESVRRRHGSYRLAPGFRMSAQPTDEEARAVLFGLVAGDRAGLRSTTGRTDPGQNHSDPGLRQS